MSKPWERLEDVVEVVTDDVLFTFLKRFLSSKDKCLNLWLISPWISPLEREEITLRDVVERVEREKIYTRVITRFPRERHYERAIEILGSARTCEISIMDSLHAKLYISYNRQMSFALLGSANLSAHSRRSLEIGLFVKDYSWGSSLIREFLDAAILIKSQPHHRIKAINSPFKKRVLSDLRKEYL